MRFLFSMGTSISKDAAMPGTEALRDGQLTHVTVHDFETLRFTEVDTHGHLLVTNGQFHRLPLLGCLLLVGKYKGDSYLVLLERIGYAEDKSYVLKVAQVARQL